MLLYLELLKTLRRCTWKETRKLKRTEFFIIFCCLITLFIFYCTNGYKYNNFDFHSLYFRKRTSNFYLLVFPCLHYFNSNLLWEFHPIYMLVFLTISTSRTFNRISEMFHPTLYSCLHGGVLNRTHIKQIMLSQLSEIIFLLTTSEIVSWLNIVCVLQVLKINDNTIFINNFIEE